MARRGAATVGADDDERRPGRTPERPRPAREPAPGSASAAWRAADEQAAAQGQGTPRQTSGVRREATDAVARGSAATKGDGARERADGGAAAAKGRRLVREPGELLPAPVGPTTTKGLASTMDRAATMFAAERYRDARKALAPMVERAPASADLRELHGLVAYRLGRWDEAVRELEAFRSLTHSSEQHPVLADCYRALGQHEQVDALWLDLRSDSPGADLVTEGRIVAAGSLADRGDTRAAIDLLAQGFTLPKRAKAHHLRRAYALADLYERAGEAPRARELFLWVQDQDPDVADVADRVAALR